jgi:hypothetical protein
MPTWAGRSKIQANKAEAVKLATDMRAVEAVLKMFDRGWRLRHNTANFAVPGWNQPARTQLSLLT